MVFARLAGCAAVLALAAAGPAHAFRVVQVVGTACAKTSLTQDYEFGCTPPDSTISYVPGQIPYPGDPEATASDVRRDADALQVLSGFNRVSASAVREGVAAPLDDLAGGATASLAITIGSSGLPAEPIVFDFDIRSAAISLLVAGGWSAGPSEEIPIAEVRALVTCTGCDAGATWFYQAQFASYNGEVVIGFNDLLDFFDPQGIGKPTWNVNNGQVGNASASLATPFLGQLALGTLAPEETFVVTYTVHARAYVGVYNPALEPLPPPDEPKVYAAAALANPFGVDHLFINDQPLSAFVPEPETAELGLAALAPLALLARRPWRRTDAL